MNDNRNGSAVSEGDRLIAMATGVLMAWLGMNAPRAEKCLRRIAALMETRPADLALYLVDLAEKEAAAVGRDRADSGDAER
ncbi:ANTAR domain-containing protein [Pedococcus bigeumensis]|nr:ANTAR domain-containing protein [Pedococcus bigeumensis]